MSACWDLYIAQIADTALNTNLPNLMLAYIPFMLTYLCPHLKKEGHIALHMSVGMSVGRYVGNP